MEKEKIYNERKRRFEKLLRTRSDCTYRVEVEGAGLIRFFESRWGITFPLFMPIDHILIDGFKINLGDGNPPVVKCPREGSEYTPPVKRGRVWVYDPARGVVYKPVSGRGKTFVLPDGEYLLVIRRYGRTYIDMFSLREGRAHVALIPRNVFEEVGGFLRKLLEE